MDPQGTLAVELLSALVTSANILVVETGACELGERNGALFTARTTLNREKNLQKFDNFVCVYVNRLSCWRQRAVPLEPIVPDLSTRRRGSLLSLILHQLFAAPPCATTQSAITAPSPLHGNNHSYNHTATHYTRPLDRCLAQLIGNGEVSKQVK